MPRRARLAIAGIPWHIIQRGNNRSACFYADEDYRRYLDTLSEQARWHGCAVHAYVLMTNHVHLLLTPDRPPRVRSCTITSSSVAFIAQLFRIFEIKLQWSCGHGKTLTHRAFRGTPSLYGLRRSAQGNLHVEYYWQAWLTYFGQACERGNGYMQRIRGAASLGSPAACVLVLD
jgi:REP element-mobilizing transposase RayT